jgi:hypothetical protein
LAQGRRQRIFDLWSSCDGTLRHLPLGRRYMSPKPGAVASEGFFYPRPGRGTRGKEQLLITRKATQKGRRDRWKANLSFVVEEAKRKTKFARQKGVEDEKFRRIFVFLE